jgi:carotenoid cleavage dioxygenase-like enzyme
MISVFRFENGHVDFRAPYVMTDRRKADRAARHGLFGLYRNPYTDGPSVRGINRCANNTTPIFHAGKLFALKEDGPAMELHPETLETIGVWDYQGKLKTRTMTAHPRPDPETGPPLIAGPVGVGFNTLTRLEMKSGRHQSMHLQGPTTLQEPVHIPSKIPGHEGYLALVVDLHAENLSDVLILDAEHIDRAPLARIKVPLRLRTQVHGNWVPADQVG